MTNHAACRRAKKSVVTGNVSCNAANRRSFDTAFGPSRSSHKSNCKHDRGAHSHELIAQIGSLAILLAIALRAATALKAEQQLR